jgi:pyruvate dehydrogenase E1 component alpha subunit
MLIDEKMASEDELKQVDAEVKAIVSESAEFAQQNPEPDISELFTDIMVGA